MCTIDHWRLMWAPALPKGAELTWATAPTRVAFVVHYFTRLEAVGGKRSGPVLSKSSPAARPS